MPFLYLACPYSHADAKVRKYRLDKVTKVTTLLVGAGMSVYSPLVSTAPIERAGVRLTSREWIRHDKPFLEAAQAMLVLTLAGWEESEGVTLEIEFMKRTRKPVLFLSEDMDRGTLFGMEVGDARQ
jgi:hypothetical protein